MNNGFICKDLYAPFVLDKDSDYLDDLKKKYKTVLKQAGDAGADAESLKILKKFKSKILEALKSQTSHLKNAVTADGFLLNRWFFET